MENDSEHKKFGLAPFATAFSLIACYGTISAIALLGALGVTIALNEAAWAGAIVLFAGLAAAAIFMRWRKHRQHLPLTLAAFGFLLIAYAMYISYSPITELGGFVFLCAGTFLDWRKERRLARK